MEDTIKVPHPGGPTDIYYIVFRTTWDGKNYVYALSEKKKPTDFAIPRVCVVEPDGTYNNGILWDVEKRISDLYKEYLQVVQQRIKEYHTEITAWSGGLFSRPISYDVVFKTNVNGKTYVVAKGQSKPDLRVYSERENGLRDLVISNAEADAIEKIYWNSFNKEQKTARQPKAEEYHDKDDDLF